MGKIVRMFVLAATTIGFACANGAPSAPPIPAPSSTVPDSAPSPNRMSGLPMTVSPSNSLISVDGIEKGPADEVLSDGVLVLPPGDYGIAVSRDGYQTWRAELSIDIDMNPIDVRLEPK